MADERNAWGEAIEILRDRLLVRFLDHSDNLLDKKYSGFAVLAIDCAVIETLEQFRQGVRKTPRDSVGQYFRAFFTTTRFKHHFTEQTAQQFYNEVRCGILHQAETQNATLIRKTTESYIVRQNSSGGLIVNVREFHKELKQTVEDYVATLADGREGTRANFIKKMNYIARYEAEDAP